MTLRRYSFLGLLLVFTLLFAGCGDDITEKLQGSWKSETPNAANGKPIVMILTKDTLNLNGNIQNIAYKTISLSVDVVDAASQKSLFLATSIGKDSVQVQGGPFPEKIKLLKITEDEAKQILGQ